MLKDGSGGCYDCAAAGMTQDTTGGTESKRHQPCIQPAELRLTPLALQVESLAADIAAGTAGEATPQSKPVFSGFLGGKSSKVGQFYMEVQGGAGCKLTCCLTDCCGAACSSSHPKQRLPTGSLFIN